MKQKIVIVDYDMGNQRSVQKKINRIGFDAYISDQPEQIIKADKLILPGVGHFANGVRKLKEKGILQVLNRKVILEKTPILGICLGMQLMGNHSEEGNVKGLGWIDANIVRFKIENQLMYKVPHIGWNNIKKEKSSTLLRNISEDAQFYFVHSYHMKCNNFADILGNSHYESIFVSAIQKENIFGTQFHPEKSHDWGEQLLRNFVNI